MFYLNGREHISFLTTGCKLYCKEHTGAHIISANSDWQTVPGAPVKPEDAPLISGSKIKWAVTNKLYATCRKLGVGVRYFPSPQTTYYLPGFGDGR